MSSKLIMNLARGLCKYPYFKISQNTFSSINNSKNFDKSISNKRECHNGKTYSPSKVEKRKVGVVVLSIISYVAYFIYDDNKRHKEFMRDALYWDPGC